MAEKDRIDEIFDGYFAEKMSRPITSDFTSKVMARVQEEAIETQEDWVKENLWIALTALFAVLFGGFIILMKRGIISYGIDSNLVESWRTHAPLWSNMIMLISVGAFYYFVQRLRSCYQTDSC